MTKTFTLENVLTQSQDNRDKVQEKLRVPESDSLKMLISYSMALQVVRTQYAGNCYLILN